MQKDSKKKLGTYFFPVKPPSSSLVKNGWSHLKVLVL